MMEHVSISDEFECKVIDILQFYVELIYEVFAIELVSKLVLLSV